MGKSWQKTLFIGLILITSLFVYKNRILPTMDTTLTELKTQFPIKEPFKLVMQFGGSIVPMGKLFLVDQKSSEKKQIKSFGELIRAIDYLNTQEEALALAQFLTNYPTRFLIKEKPFNGVEPKEIYKDLPYDERTVLPIDGFLTETNVTETTDVLKCPQLSRNGTCTSWQIERDIILYPEMASDRVKKGFWPVPIPVKDDWEMPAALVRTKEVIDLYNKTYSFKVEKILAEGDEVNTLLPYYR